MCHSNHTNNNNTPGSSYEENHSINTKKLTLSPNPSRKTRTKTRKPKFLSLQRELITQGNSPDSGEMTHHHQLNLFPLHPENLFEEKDIHDDNVAYLFNTDGGATLNGLLGSGGGGGVVSSEKNSLSPSLTYAYGGQDSDEGASSLLARAALRHKERDDSEEKWVFYSEVVEEKKEEEVSSCSAAGAVSTIAGDNQLWCKNQSSRVLSLKLDYEEILNAWSDKSPLFIEGECPQTVPDVLDDSATVLGDGGCMGNGLLWTVPDDGSSEIISGDGGSGIHGGGGGGGGESWKMAGQREASVLRYKEKRQNRLFAKRIRYEVRKLNAEKRPRMKGRFVKRS